MAVLLSATESERQGWAKHKEWEGRRRQLVSLLKCLEEVGCFVLRRGTIESYYRNKSTDKVVAAIQEAESLESQSEENIREQYDDIVRALFYVAHAPQIDEALLLSEVLLAVVAPALDRLAREATESELGACAREMVGEKASLFRLSKVQNGGEAALRVDLKTPVLDASGFPIIFVLGCNVNEKVSRAFQTVTPAAAGDSAIDATPKDS